MACQGFIQNSEEVSVDLFISTVCSLAEKDEEVIAPGEFSGLERQRGELPILAELDFAGPAPDVHQRQVQAQVFSDGDAAAQIERSEPGGLCLERRERESCHR